MDYSESNEMWVKRVSFVLSMATIKGICSEDESMAIMRLCFRNMLKSPYKLALKEGGY